MTVWPGADDKGLKCEGMNFNFFIPLLMCFKCAIIIKICNKYIIVTVKNILS